MTIRKNKNGNYWKNRARNYNNLGWAKEESYIDAFIKASKFKKTDLVLDVGTGTGIIAHTIAPLVGQVIGLDKSQDMLKQSNWNGNQYFIRRDILDPIFRDEVFDKVTARHVFHHIIEKTQEATNECYRLLKKGGAMILSEGVPPCIEVRQDYIEIFKLKEERLTFMEEDLVNLMKNAGFKNIKVYIHRLKGMSIRNWVANSALTQSVQDRIFDMHVNAGDYFKKAYHLVEVDGDCFIDIKMAIITGEKR